MGENIYSIVRSAIQSNGGKKDPEQIAGILGLEFIPLYGTISGYASYYNQGYPIKVIALNENLRLKNPTIWVFGGFHEIGHVLYEDIFDESVQFNGMVSDLSFCKCSVDSKRISFHEKRTNIFSADVVLEDNDVASVTGCDGPLVLEYQEVRKSIHETWVKIQKLRQVAQRESSNSLLIARLKEYERRFKEEKENIEDIECQIINSSYCKTAAEAAYQLGTEEIILGFKIEAMRGRGIEIPQFSDLNYRKVFKNIG